MSDECEQLFSSSKSLINDCRSRLLMDIIEANEYLRSWYGRPKKKTFDKVEAGILQGEGWGQRDIRDILRAQDKAHDDSKGSIEELNSPLRGN